MDSEFSLPAFTHLEFLLVSFLEMAFGVIVRAHGSEVKETARGGVRDLLIVDAHARSHGCVPGQDPTTDSVGILRRKDWWGGRISSGSNLFMPHQFG